MAFGNGRTSLSLEEIQKEVGDINIASHYLGITKIPCVINSPLRVDKRPSLSIYISHNAIKFLDFATGEHGSLYTLLMLMWHCTFRQVLDKIVHDLKNSKHKKVEIVNSMQPGRVTLHQEVSLQCKIREWRQHDIDYWTSYGVALEWLKYAEVYPISHKIVTKEDETYVFTADKYAYAFVERKEGNVTLKIYQPFNTAGFKWSNKHDRSVISLWTKIPANGDVVVICSSLKDALCLWSNTGIPAISVQGEGYTMSNTAINELKKRFKKTYILFDNDEAGIKDGAKLALQTGFINLVLPSFEGGKDVSDAYKTLGREKFLQMMEDLFKEKKETDNLPF